jgi:hypothetical protein
MNSIVPNNNPLLRSQLNQDNNLSTTVGEASVNQFVEVTPLKTALLDGLHRPTQTEIQGMSDEVVGELNRQEIKL